MHCVIAVSWLSVLLMFFVQVSALVTLYTHEEDIDSAIDVFSQAIQYYQSKQVTVSKPSVCKLRAVELRL